MKSSSRSWQFPTTSVTSVRAETKLTMKTFFCTFALCMSLTSAFECPRGSHYFEAKCYKLMSKYEDCWDAWKEYDWQPENDEWREVLPMTQGESQFLVETFAEGVKAQGNDGIWLDMFYTYEVGNSDVFRWFTSSNTGKYQWNQNVPMNNFNWADGHGLQGEIESKLRQMRIDIWNRDNDDSLCVDKLADYAFYNPANFRGWELKIRCSKLIESHDKARDQMERDRESSYNAYMRLSDYKWVDSKGSQSHSVASHVCKARVDSSYLGSNNGGSNNGGSNNGDGGDTCDTDKALTCVGSITPNSNDLCGSSQDVISKTFECYTDAGCTEIANQVCKTTINAIREQCPDLTCSLPVSDPSNAVGIAVGVTIGVLVVIGVLFVLYRKNKCKNNKKTSTPPPIEQPVEQNQEIQLAQNISNPEIQQVPPHMQHMCQSIAQV